MRATQYDKENGLKFKFQKAVVDIDLVDIAETIKIVMKQNGHNDESIPITANTNTLKSVLEIQSDFQVDFRARNSRHLISSVLGIQNQVYEEVYKSGLQSLESAVKRDRTVVNHQKKFYSTITSQPKAETTGLRRVSSNKCCQT